MKTIHIKAFQLLEARGDGSGENDCGLIVERADAISWVGRSAGYRRYVEVSKTIEIAESLEEYDDHQRKLKRQTILARLSKEDRVSLGFPAELEDIE